MGRLVLATGPFTHSAGFGDLCAVIASFVAFLAAWITARQRRAADGAAMTESQRRRELDAREGEIHRLWDRYVWLVDQLDDLGADLVGSLMGRLTASADRLADPDLEAFTRVFVVSVFDTANRRRSLRDADDDGILNSDEREREG